MRSTLLNKVASTGAGESVKVARDDNYPDSGYVIQVDITGAPTAVSVALEGSLDDSTFAILATHDFTADELTAEVAIFSVVGFDVDFLQANLTTLTAGTSPTVTAKLKVG